MAVMSDTMALDAARAAIGEARAGVPSVVDIVADAGFGKTRMLRNLRDDLDGFEVFRAFGEPEAPSSPFQTVVELLGSPVPPDMLNPFSATRLLTDAVDAARDARPVAFVVDDLQWCDPDSVRTIAALLRRAAGDRLLLVAAHRPLPATFPEWDRMLRDVEGRSIELASLDVEQIGALIGARSAASPDGLAEALRQHTGGNPLYTVSLLGSHSVEELTDMARDGGLPAPERLAVELESRLAAMSADAAALLQTLAVLGDEWTLLDMAARVGDVEDAADAARILSREGLIRTRGTGRLTEVRIFHSVLRAAVYDATPTARRRRLHGAAAARATDRRTQLAHRVAARADVDDALAAELADLARTQHEAHRYRDAARSYQLAATCASDADGQRRMQDEATIERLLALDPEAARAELTTGDPVDRLIVAMSMVNLGEWRRAAEALAPLDEAALADLPPRTAFRILATRARAGTGGGLSAAAVLADVAAAQRLAEPDAALSMPLRHAYAQSALTRISDEELWQLSAGDRPREELALSPEGRTALSWRGIVFGSNGYVRDAIGDLSLVTAMDAAGSGDYVEGTLRALLGLSYFLGGDFARASVNIELARSHGLADTLPLVLGVSGLGTLLGADEAATRADEELARHLLIRNPHDGPLMVADVTGILVEALTGTPESRRTWIRRRMSELSPPEQDRRSGRTHLWLSMQGIAAGWDGRPGDALAWADRLERRTHAPEWQAPMVRMLRTRATAADVDRTDVFVELARGGFPSVPVFAMLAARDAAASAVRHERPDAAAVRDFAASVIAPLEHYGARVTMPAPEPSGVDDDGDADAGEALGEPFAMLSDRERAVAALVIDGMSYAQIAQELYVTRSTVSFHLSRCYAKTGTHSRHELAQLARLNRRRPGTAGARSSSRV
jgi:DNA-binding CsgD family transcriptional regulator